MQTNVEGKPLIFHYFLSVAYIDARRLTVECGTDGVAVGVVVAHGAAGISCLDGTDARGAAKCGGQDIAARRKSREVSTISGNRGSSVIRRCLVPLTVVLQDVGIDSDNCSVAHSSIGGTPFHAVHLFNDRYLRFFLDDNTCCSIYFTMKEKLPYKTINIE